MERRWTLRWSLALAVLLVAAMLPRVGHATLIDLNDFFFFAGDPVVVAGDGSSATISEGAFSPVILSNLPPFDPEVIIAGAGTSLSFDFDFAEGPVPDDDEFGAFIIDAGTGFSAGAAFEFFTDFTSSGTISFDLSSLVGTTLGLQFQLSALAGDFGLGSVVTISDVMLVTVPEPPTLVLFLGGLLMVFLWRGQVPGRIEM